MASGQPWADGLSKALEAEVEVSGAPSAPAGGAVSAGVVSEGPVLEGVVSEGAVRDGVVLDDEVLDDEVLDEGEVIVVGAFVVVEDLPASSGRQDASNREAGIANATGIKRRRVIQVGCCSVNRTHPIGRTARNQ